MKLTCSRHFNFLNFERLTVLTRWNYKRFYYLGFENVAVGCINGSPHQRGFFIRKCMAVITRWPFYRGGRKVGFCYVRSTKKNTLSRQSIPQEKQRTSQNTNCTGHPFMGRLTFVNCWWNLGSHLQTVLLPVKTKPLSTSILLYAQLCSNVAFLQVEQDTPSIRGLYNPLWVSSPTVNTQFGKFGSIRFNKLAWKVQRRN